MPTVYILGAGASVDIGYPLAANMGRELLNYMAASSVPDFRAAGEFFSERFGDSPDIEAVLTEVQSRIDFLEAASEQALRLERSRLAQELSWLNFGIQAWFREIRIRPANSYERFSRSVLVPGDTVITFNYDDSLDRELHKTGQWDISDGYGFSVGPVSEPSQIRILKLHGSINWLLSYFAGRTGFFTATLGGSLGNTPVLHNVDLEFLGYRDFKGAAISGGAASPCLILPTRNKRFFYKTSFGQEFEPFWDTIWEQARSALRRADQIVMCGYSLLPVDQRACDLILLAPRTDCPVEIVCGSQSARISDAFCSKGFTKVEAFSGYFADWLATRSVSPHTVTSF